MKITFLASSVMNWPGDGYGLSCTMIQIGNRYYFVDMGSNGVRQMIERRLEPSRVHGIFITHMHGEHTDGLVGSMNILACNTKINPPVFLPVVEAGKIITEWIAVNLVHMREMDYRQVTPGVIFDDGVLRVTAYRNTHCFNSFSYLLEAEGKAMIFSGDLGGSWETERFSLALPKIETELPVALMVCEAAHGKVDYYREHIERLNPQKFVFNHFGGQAMGSMRKLQEDLPEQMFLYAQDDMELEL